MSSIQAFITSAQAYMVESRFVDFTIAHCYPWDEHIAARDRWRQAKQQLIEQGTALATALEQQGIDSSPITETLNIVGFGGPEALRGEWARIGGALRRIVARDGMDAPKPVVVPDATAILTFKPGGYVYHDVEMPLNGKPLAILTAIHDSRWRTKTADDLLTECWDHNEQPELGTLYTHVNKARASLRQAMKKANVEGTADPLPCVDSGANLAWRLDIA